MSQDTDYLEMSVNILKVGGMLPTKYKFLNKFNVKHVGILVYAAIYFSIFLDAMYKEITFEFLMELIESLISYLQGTAKILVLTVYCKDFQNLLTLRKQFWGMDMFGKPTEKKLKVYSQTAYKVIMIYIAFITITTIPVVLKPFMMNELPVKCWVPNGPKWFYAMAILQYVSFACQIIYFVGFDWFFCQIYISATIQYKLLKIALTKMETVEDIKVCAKYHDFISRFVKTMNKAFEIFLLFQYLYTMLIVCIELLMIADPSKEFTIKVKSMGYLIIMYIQLSMTYIPASMLQDESDDLSTGLLFCDWPFKNQEFHEKFMFVLKIAQKKIVIKAGGMFEVDRRAFIEAFRTAISIYTLIVRKFDRGNAP